MTALSALNETLKRYLEEVIEKVRPDDAARIIRTEKERLEDVRKISRASQNPFVEWLSRAGNSKDDAVLLIRDAADFEHFAKELARRDIAMKGLSNTMLRTLSSFPEAGMFRDLNDVRTALNLTSFTFPTGAELDKLRLEVAEIAPKERPKSEKSKKKPKG